MNESDDNHQAKLARRQSTRRGSMHPTNLQGGVAGPEDGTGAGGTRRKARDRKPASDVTIDALTDKCIIRVLDYISHKDLLKVGMTSLNRPISAERWRRRGFNARRWLVNSKLCAQSVSLVCHRWKKLTEEPALWQVVSLRPQYDGLSVRSQEKVIQLIGQRWNLLRWIELGPELITLNIIQELANTCPKLNYLTMDFSTAAQLHDFTDLQSFPSRLLSLTLCLSENIFLEGLLRKIYTYVSSVERLHIVGTYEKIEDEEEEVYETVNIYKLKQYMPNLRVVNLFGVAFVTDEHVDSLSANCAKLECICVNYCNKVTGRSIKSVAERCRQLTTLLVAHTSLTSSIISEIAWENTKIEELDVSGTELTAEALISMLTRLHLLRWFKAGFLEYFTDEVLYAWTSSGAMANVQYLDLDTCDSLNDHSVSDCLTHFGWQFKAFGLGGHHKLTENFWMQNLVKMPHIEMIIMGIPEDCCKKVTAKVTVDQFIDHISKSCKYLRRLEMRWDDETLRFADKSSKFIDVLRLRCQRLHSVVLADGQYYEIVRSNFERAGRPAVVRSTEMCATSMYEHLRHYSHLLFN